MFWRKIWLLNDRSKCITLLIRGKQTQKIKFSVKRDFLEKRKITKDYKNFFSWWKLSSEIEKWMIWTISEWLNENWKCIQSRKKSWFQVKKIKLLKFEKAAQLTSRNKSFSFPKFLLKWEKCLTEVDHQVQLQIEVAPILELVHDHEVQGWYSQSGPPSAISQDGSTNWTLGG